MRAPDVAILDELKGLYVPVRFDHQGHAHMAEMTHGCAIWDHYTPEGQQHPACRTCQGLVVKGTGIHKPGWRLGLRLGQAGGLQTATGIGGIRFGGTDMKPGSFTQDHGPRAARDAKSLKSIRALEVAAPSSSRWNKSYSKRPAVTSRLASSGPPDAVTLRSGQGARTPCRRPTPR
jgi:hypothetical protein